MCVCTYIHTQHIYLYIFIYMYTYIYIYFLYIIYYIFIYYKFISVKAVSIYIYIYSWHKHVFWFFFFLWKENFTDIIPYLRGYWRKMGIKEVNHFLRFSEINTLKFPCSITKSKERKDQEVPLLRKCFKWV